LELSQKQSFRGECVLVVAGKPKQQLAEQGQVLKELDHAMKKGNESLSQMAARIAKQTGWTKSAVYKLALEHKEGE
jgi:16S rRNA C1402 (ribose-2'-O) methylase RsmI